MDSKLLEILCCPITRRGLHNADANLLSRINAAIESGKVRNHGGVQVAEMLTAALVTPEGDLVYPVRGDVPILLEEECIHWAAFKD
jgi:uncharacterized protein YbaR (Trm112 family)